MIDIFMQNWQWVIGTISALIVGFYIPGLRGILIAGFRAMMTERVLKIAAVSFLSALVKSTNNKLDDAWFEEFKKAMEE